LVNIAQHSAACTLFLCVTMETNKPSLEHLGPTTEATIFYNAFEGEELNQYKFWHYHREVEIIYINKGSGKRYIGSHMSYFKEGELILIGAMLPHYCFIDPVKPGQKKISLQMREGFPGVTMLMMPEMQPVRQLLERARLGVSFFGTTKTKVGKKLEKMEDLSPIDKVMETFDVLKLLALSDEYRTLNPEGFRFEITTQDNERLRNIFNYIREHFKRQISLEEMAVEANMTPPAFARYFKKNTGKTFTQFVNEYRLVHASKLLAEKPTSITDICFESGFNNFSHFSKLFREYSGKSPSEYRKEFRQIVGE
jgi:AraC-like DNA-binding protein